MLFARYLTENGLLIHPEFRIVITLKECRELTEEQGADLWELASRYAQVMLLEIFRTSAPVFRVPLPPETRQALVASLPPKVFTASDSLGWTDQIWQAKEEDRKNKIGASELPAVMQLLTEHYMVRSSVTVVFP